MSIVILYVTVLLTDPASYLPALTAIPISAFDLVKTNDLMILSFLLQASERLFHMLNHAQ